MWEEETGITALRRDKYLKHRQSQYFQMMLSKQDCNIWIYLLSNYLKQLMITIFFINQNVLPICFACVLLYNCNFCNTLI